ncbi:polysaccharide deacetylase family protein, partial [uncultured Vibrio sp.]|uniref:polysaccharide deacetylase family protein n=1 Tax=uncultured Vibrio sp. TaxID=114054 RepID=UPI00260BB69C
MKVLQCWDDGVVSDIRLIEILKKYNATATFNLCIGKNGEDREVVGQFEEVDIVSLKRSELYDLYKDFDVANHSLTHPFLSSLSYEEVHHEVAQNKAQLETVFHREIKGFCYPFGSALLLKSVEPFPSPVIYSFMVIRTVV